MSNHTQITKTIGRQLRNYYESTGTSQERLAKELGTKQSWISRIYQGHFTERSKVARELCRRAGIAFVDESKYTIEIKNETAVMNVAKQILRLSKNDRKALTKLTNLLAQLD